MSPASSELTLEQACARLGLDPAARDLQSGLQGAFHRAVSAKKAGDAHLSPGEFRDLLDAYRLLRGLAPAAPPHERTFEVWPSQILLTPIEAVTGGMKAGRLPTGRPFTTRLPPGLRDGDLVWVLGWLIQARIENADDLEVRGDDLWITARKPESALRTGCRITVETPMGPWSFRISEQIVEKRLARVLGAGLPAARRHPQGDLYVRFALEADRGPAGLIRRFAHGRAA